METSIRLREPMKRWVAGEENAFEEVVAVAYPDLRRVADRLLSGRGSDLEPEELISEAFAHTRAMTPTDDPNYFFALMKKKMRGLVIDRHRAANRLCRGGGAIHYPIFEPGENDFEGRSI